MLIVQQHLHWICSSKTGGLKHWDWKPRSTFQTHDAQHRRIYLQPYPLCLHMLFFALFPCRWGWAQAFDLYKEGGKACRILQNSLSHPQVLSHFLELTCFLQEQTVLQAVHLPSNLTSCDQSFPTTNVVHCVFTM